MPEPANPGRTWMTYREAAQKLGRNTSIELAEYTELARIDHSMIVVKYLETIVVRINRNGSYQLDSNGGWSPARNIINRHSPAKLLIDIVGRWVIHARDRSGWNAMYVDGMIIDRFGREICRRHNRLTQHNAA